MKLTSSFDIPKTLNANNMETLIECQSEGNIKEHPLLASCESEDGVCQLIGVKKRKKVLSWPFLIRRLSAWTDLPGALEPELKASLSQRPLSAICSNDDTLPRPIQDILAVLCLKGPSTEGVFRKAANEKARKELKEELSSGGTVDLEGLPVHLLAAVLKDFLRSIPRKLLSCDLFEEWMDALEKQNEDNRVEALKQVAEKLPRPNFLLLKYLLYVLRLISKNAEVNKMDSSNLAICIGPNVLAPDNDQHLSFEAQKDLNNKVKALVEFLIDNCFQIFGENIPAPPSLPSDDTDGSDLSTLQSDSAYDSTSTDPDTDSSGVADSPGRQPQAPSDLAAGSDKFRLEPIASTVARLKSCASQPDRRHSEPGMSSSRESLEGRVALQKLTRSEEGFTRPPQGEAAAEPFPEEVFCNPEHRSRRPGDLKLKNLTQGLALRRGLVSKACSSSSLDGPPNSPLLASPSSPQRGFFTRHQSFISKGSEKGKPSRELKKHSLSFSFTSHKPASAKPAAAGPGTAKGCAGDPGRKGQKRESQLAGRIIQDTFGTEMHHRLAGGLSLQACAHSLVDEVFPPAEGGCAGSPPSYEEAMRCQVAGLMDCTGQTVASMRARMLGGDCREQPHCARDSWDVCGEQPRTGHSLSSLSDGPAGLQATPQPPELLRLRMAADSLLDRQDCGSRRCSQPVFEVDQFQYVKESYI